MLDGLVGHVFEVRHPNDVFRGRFTVTAVNGTMASVVDAENHQSTVSVWSLMRCWHNVTIWAGGGANDRRGDE